MSEIETNSDLRTNMQTAFKTMFVSNLDELVSYLENFDLLAEFIQNFFKDINRINDTNNKLLYDPNLTVVLNNLFFLYIYCLCLIKQQQSNNLDLQRKINKIKEMISSFYAEFDNSADDTLTKIDLIRIIILNGFYILFDFLDNSNQESNTIYQKFSEIKGMILPRNKLYEKTVEEYEHYDSWIEGEILNTSLMLMLMNQFPTEIMSEQSDSKNISDVEVILKFLEWLEQVQNEIAKVGTNTQEQ